MTNLSSVTMELDECRRCLPGHQWGRLWTGSEHEPSRCAASKALASRILRGLESGRGPRIMVDFLALGDAYGMSRHGVIATLDDLERDGLIGREAPLFHRYYKVGPR